MSQEINVDTQKKNNDQEIVPEDGSPVIRWVYDWLGTMILAVVIVLSVMALFLRQVTVNGPSMNDTLADGDRLLVSSFMYTPKQGDIVVVSHGENNLRNEAIIKRVIATEGQHIEIRYNENIKESHVYVDGSEIKEDYILKFTDLKRGSGVTEEKENGQTILVLKQDIEEGHVFVMGDNRTNSLDSRNNENVGQVPVENLIGKAVFRIYPLNKFGPIE